MGTVELQKSRIGPDVMSPDGSGAFDTSTMAHKGRMDGKSRCPECDVIDSVKRGDQLRVCAGCKLVVHEKCYAIVLPAAEEEETSRETAKEDDAMTSSEWKCDCCRHGVESLMVQCVYCERTGDAAALRSMETSDKAVSWSLFAGCQDEKRLTMENKVPFGHVLCINWDPRRLAVHTVKESKMKPVEKGLKKGLVKKAAKEAATEATSKEVEKADEPLFVKEAEKVVPDVREVVIRDLLPFGDCCFCHSSGGVRIQCRRVNCGRDFHVMCAYQGSGHVELRTGHFLQFHAYCDRHRDCSEDIGDLLAKLITRPIRLLVGRDDMRRFGTVAKNLLGYVSAAAVMRDLAALMVGYCNKGLRACKNEPPDYNVKHLQVLQFFLSHVPQLEKVYALPSTPIQDFVNDKKLFRRLERAFNPPRYVATYPGPFSQQYTCNVCLDPFHDRQHVFYCSSEDKSAIPHVQHWRCTKRLSNARERERYLPVAGSTGIKKKRKVISIVQNGVRKDITLPKGLPSMTDDVICGVCRAPVDVRGLVASRKEAKKLDFEKKESKFVQNGCYINPVGAKGFSYGLNVSSRKPAKSADGKSNRNWTGQHAVAQQALGPPKMERINVQRTTRWLACVAQIIRLVVAPAPAASADSSSRSSSLAAIGSLNSGVAISTITAASAVNGTTGAAPTKTLSGISTPSNTAIKKATRNDTGPLEITSVDGRSQSSTSTIAAAATSSTAPLPKPIPKAAPSLVTPAVQALFDEVMRLVRPYDSYALSKLETAYDMLLNRSGPGVAVLRMFTHEYTRFVYIKHTRAVEKARNEKRKRAEHEAQENREKERNRMSLEAERALKKQMLAMRNRQRQHLQASSSK